MNIRILLISLLCLTSAVQAEYKIVTIDINQLLNETSEAKTKRAEVDKVSASARKQLEAKKASLQALEKKVKESKDQKDLESFKTQQREFAKFVRETDESIQKQISEFNQVLTEKAMKIIATYAEEQKIDLVLYKGEKPRGPILYGQASGDITADIMARMNK